MGHLLFPDDVSGTSIFKIPVKILDRVFLSKIDVVQMQFIVQGQGFPNMK